MIRRLSALSKGELSRIIERNAGEKDEKIGLMREIFGNVAAKGDFALQYYAGKFGGKTPKKILLEKEEIASIASRAGGRTVAALEDAAKRIRAFATAELPKSWMKKFGSSIMGKKITPVEKVGVYVPGGTAAYLSTVLMCCIPAKVAGVREIVVCTPPKDQYNPAVFAALHIAGIERVFLVGGAQAIAAMAVGTQTVPRVSKIVGPGNAFVNAAKKFAAATGVAIDSPAGPSEIMIIADVTARPCWVAADLLAQAEHDENASAILVTTSERLAEGAEMEAAKQLESLPRKEIAKASWENNGKIFVADSIAQAVEFANAYAPEHLEIITKNAEKVAEKITNAGAIFAGKWSCEALGDCGFGPNHTLPTGGAARAYGGLSSGSFCKETSVMVVSEGDSKGFAKIAASIARAEGLEGHARSARKRMG